MVVVSYSVFERLPHAIPLYMPFIALILDRFQQHDNFNSFDKNPYLNVLSVIYDTFPWTWSIHEPVAA